MLEKSYTLYPGFEHSFTQKFARKILKLLSKTDYFNDPNSPTERGGKICSLLCAIFATTHFLRMELNHRTSSILKATLHISS